MSVSLLTMQDYMDLMKEKEESNIKYDVKKNHVKTSADGLMNSSRR